MRRDVWSIIEESRHICRQSWEARARAIMTIEDSKVISNNLTNTLRETRRLLQSARQIQSKEIIRK